MDSTVTRSTTPARRGAAPPRLLGALIVSVLVAACADPPPDSVYVFADGDIPIECEPGGRPRFEAIATSPGERRGFHQQALSTCRIRVEVPPDSRLRFRVSAYAPDFRAGRGSRAAISSNRGGAPTRLFSAELHVNRPFREREVELESGPQELVLHSLETPYGRETGGLTWIDVAILSRTPDPGPGWIVRPEVALAPFLASRPREDAAPARRLLVVGFDGAGWRLLEQALAAGELPTLAELRSRGTWGELRSVPIPDAAASWSGLATGLGAGRTGVYAAPARLTQPAFWQVAERGGVVPLVASVPLDAPVDRGFYIAEAEALEAHPPELVPALARAGILSRPVELRISSRVVDQLERRGRVFASLLAGTDWELGFVVFRHTDAVVRLFGLYTDPWQRVLQAFDRELGRVVRAAGDGTTVLLVSSHAWRYFDRTVDLNAWARSQGWGADFGSPEAGSFTSLRSAPFSIRDELLARVLTVTAPGAAEPLVRSVTPLADLYPGPHPPPGVARIEGHERYRLAVGGASGRKRVFRGGGDGRSRDGLYLVAGPGVEAGAGPVASVHDVAPSVLQFFGVESPETDGKLLPGFAP